MFNYRNHIFYGLLDGTGGLTPIDDEPEETSNLPEDDKFWEYVEVEEASQSSSGGMFEIRERPLVGHDGERELDKTYTEILEAYQAGKLVCLLTVDSIDNVPVAVHFNYLAVITFDETGGTVTFMNDVVYSTDDSDGYPNTL